MSTASLAKTAYDEVVEELIEQINMGRSYEELFDSLYDRLRGVVPYNRIAVALLEPPGDGLTLISCHSDGPESLKVGYSAPVEGSTLRELLLTGQPRIINDLPDYLAKKPHSVSTMLIVKEGMRSNLTLPLVAGGKPIGVVFFSSRETGTYDEQHARLLKRLAGHIAISIEKAQFLQKLEQEVHRQTMELKRSEERYRLLVGLGQIINSSLDLRQVFQHAAEEIHKLVGCDRVSLILVSSEDNSRRGFALEFAQDAKWVEIPTQSLSDSAAQWVIEHRQPRIARDLAQARPFVEDRQLFEQGYRAYVYLPLICRNQSVGILGLANRKENQLELWDLQLLNELSNVLATALDNASAYTQIAQLKAQLEEENVYLRDEIKTEHDFSNLVGEGRAMLEVRKAIEQVATTDSTVLILGETGTGKELIARAIHELSPRRNHLLVKVNCAAMAPGVITSELFGHEQGAFTGATKRRLGRFELAQQGSIFLDEIAEIPSETQVLLLRVLQERVIERVGAAESIAVNVRVIAATNRDLKAFVDAGRFREDLFYRLHVFPISVPALRERREDIPALINHFIHLFERRMNKQITQVHRRTMELLMNYHWPGNVRELENILERAMIVTSGDTLEIDPTWLSTTSATSDGQPTMAELERRAILEALQRSSGKVYGPGGAAQALGLKPTTLYGKMRKHHISKKHAAGTFA
jgi:formate hydrogenlyase transcriptional activator